MENELKEKSNLKSFNQWLSKNSILIITILLVLLLISPWLLTHYSIIDLSKNSGIGSNIGGITAPFIGLITAILLYLTLIRQSENNKNSTYEANSRIIQEELRSLRGRLDSYEFHGKRSRIALNSTILQAVAIINDRKNLKFEEEYYYEFINLLRDFENINYTIDNLEVSATHKKIMLMSYFRLFDAYFGSAKRFFEKIDSEKLKQYPNQNFAKRIRKLKDKFIKIYVIADEAAKKLKAEASKKY